MTDSMIDTIHKAINEAQENADATQDEAHVEAAYEACEHIENRLNVWAATNREIPQSPINTDNIRLILDCDGSAADKIETLYSLLPPAPRSVEKIERELSGVKNINLVLVDRVKELAVHCESLQIQNDRQANTITSLKTQINRPVDSEPADGLEVLRHKTLGPVIAVKGDTLTGEGLRAVHYLKPYEFRDGARLCQRFANPSLLTPITEGAGE